MTSHKDRRTQPQVSETIRSKCRSLSLSSRSLRREPGGWEAPGLPALMLLPLWPVSSPRTPDAALSISKSQEAGTSTRQLWIDSHGWISPRLQAFKEQIWTRGDLEGSLCIDASLAGRVPRILSFLRHFLEEGAGILLPGSAVLSSH